MRFLASFIMQGRMQAIAVAATALMLSLLFPPLSLLAAAVVALVTLRLGWREGLNTLLAASLAAGLLGAIVLGNFVLPAAYGLLLWLPVWGTALFLRLSRDLGLTLALLTVIGMAGVILVYAVMNDPADFWYQRLQAVFGPVWRQAGADTALWQPQLVTMARYMTGIMAAGMVSSLALSLIWGRWWQALLYNPGGFRQEFLALRLRPSLAWFTFALVGAGDFCRRQAARGAGERRDRAFRPLRVRRRCRPARHPRRPRHARLALWPLHPDGAGAPRFPAAGAGGPERCLVRLARPFFAG
ncbi:hypothetical protein MIT9_P0284 [Methylomarinovum caldicuralii]|uniref:DUF2232 domain-containing protein n=1 Tax=Methylomarinovum caldicuralii TaxID=438856 RepID=A0AAU9CLH8_9GAMM|nr:hypothetical protein [Methylomarinovum caldicuralii]BCX80708.1 hypothetical protein MIT9_P0284 [Methylomarinovum caldicuralii]